MPYPDDTLPSLSVRSWRGPQQHCVSSSERRRTTATRSICGTDGRTDGTLLASSRILRPPRLSLSLSLSLVSCWALFGSCDICSFAAGAEAHNLPREAPPPPRRDAFITSIYQKRGGERERERERGGDLYSKEEEGRGRAAKACVKVSSHHSNLLNSTNHAPQPRRLPWPSIPSPSLAHTTERSRPSHSQRIFLHQNPPRRTGVLPIRNQIISKSTNPWFFIGGKIHNYRARSE